MVAHASHALDLTRRAEQKRDPDINGLCWTRLKDPGRLSDSRHADLESLLASLTTKRTARGYRRMSTIRTIILLIASRLEFRTINPRTA